MKIEYKPPKIVKDLGMQYATESSKQKSHYCIYECGYCGKEFKAQTGDINNRGTISCGCQRKTNPQNITHGLGSHRFYDTWRNMIRRCTDILNVQYHNYGGRGILVCEEWQDVTQFIEWCESTHPNVKGVSLDRIDNDKGYNPENCRWADMTIQSLNKRKPKNNTSGYVGINWRASYNKWAVRITVNGKRLSLGYFEILEEAVQARDNYIIENKLPHKLSTEY